jgi:hypothetical protein
MFIRIEIKQTPSETVFGDGFWVPNTFSESIWSTREYV